LLKQNKAAQDFILVLNLIEIVIFTFEMKRKLVYIIRHGETDFNRLGIVQGSGVDMELNERGKQQASAFYHYHQKIRFKHIFISKLIRTQQSVLPFIENGFKHSTHAELNEISWGIYEGKPQSKEERETYWEVVNAWASGNFSAKLIGGESAIELQTRQMPIINKITNYDADTVLVCMHGRAMKSLLCTMLNRPLTEMENFAHSNLCLYLLEYDGESYQLLKANETSHLS
jgi:broad specificity phosphatase PhoE